jgi:hypothetical protein
MMEMGREMEHRTQIVARKEREEALPAKVSIQC